VRALSIRPVEFPFTERRAEPILIAKLINGAVGGFNRMLFNLFFHHEKGSHQRLDGTRFLALVEHVDELVAGKEERSRFGPSVACEIFDVHKHRRIFLDAHAHQEDIQTLLGATNLFNVKRLWSIPEPSSQREAVKEAVRDILLAASTEKLALIAGGEYVGKDDPVLLGVEEMVAPIFEYMKTGFYMTQGDERGSHYMMLVPKPLPESVATVRSRGLQVGLAVTLSADRIAEVHDVYARPGYREARVRIDKANARIWRAQGSEFTPVGVGARDVEPAYPLMKVLNRITGEGSTLATPIRSSMHDLYLQTTQMGE
jgi:fructose 1,6-bisphosphatase